MKFSTILSTLAGADIDQRWPNLNFDSRDKMIRKLMANPRFVAMALAMQREIEADGGTAKAGRTDEPPNPV